MKRMLILAWTMALVCFSANAQKKVAILVYDGVEVIDYSGPYEAFYYAYKDGQHYYTIYTVASSKQPITCRGGLQIIPTYTFEDAPAPDLLLIPGGSVQGNPAVDNDSTIAWIRKVAAGSPTVMSVCNGATLLSKAGVLDGKEVTSNAYIAYFKTIEQFCNNCRVVYDKRFVWSGKVITTGGLAAGIDGALSVVEKELGKAAATEAALSMEYYWNPASFSRADFAEATFLNTYYLLKGAAFKGNIIKTEGDNAQWEKVIKVYSEAGKDSLVQTAITSLTARDKWLNLSKTGDYAYEASFTDLRGLRFKGWVEFTDLGKNEFLVRIRVKRI